MANFAHRLRVSDNITSDMILSPGYAATALSGKELSRHLFEAVEEGFCKKVKQGDYLVAGMNFGSGSTLENSAAALKGSGIQAVIAKSFARMFYRNALNVGLTLVECETNYIDDMDELSLDLEKNLLMNRSKGVQVEIKPSPKIVRRLLSGGGLVQYFREHRGFAELFQ